MPKIDKLSPEAKRVFKRAEIKLKPLEDPEWLLLIPYFTVQGEQVYEDPENATQVDLGEDRYYISQLGVSLIEARLEREGVKKGEIDRAVNEILIKLQLQRLKY